MTNISYYILNIHIIIYSLNDIFLSKQTCGLDDLREGFPQSVGPLKHMEQNLFKDRRKYWMELVFHSLYIYIYIHVLQSNKSLAAIFHHYTLSCGWETLITLSLHSVITHNQSISTHYSYDYTSLHTIWVNYNTVNQ